MRAAALALLIALTGTSVPAEGDGGAEKILHGQQLFSRTCLAAMPTMRDAEARVTQAFKTEFARKGTLRPGIEIRTMGPLANVVWQSAAGSRGDRNHCRVIAQGVNMGRAAQIWYDAIAFDGPSGLRLTPIEARPRNYAGLWQVEGNGRDTRLGIGAGTADTVFIALSWK
ncbi:hypothetical protein [Litorisediminicola beolgyonensis]|uniref:Uncharacterized protein n=1 Tax=Litorisediminicola beolgyonensis TaxID=1173614 RepID=A0ABW3ZCV2_9RHOB